MTVNFKLIILKLSILLVPSYSVAYLTDKMVYVVPTLAAALVVAFQFRTRRQKNADLRGWTRTGWKVPALALTPASTDLRCRFIS